MESERFIIETEDGEVQVPRTDLISLEVELDSELASMFRLRLATRQQRDGTWTYLDEERFRIWKPITITAGFDTGAEALMSGYITHVKPAFDPDPYRAHWKSGAWTAVSSWTGRRNCGPGRTRRIATSPRRFSVSMACRPWWRIPR